MILLLPSILSTITSEPESTLLLAPIGSPTVYASDDPAAILHVADSGRQIL